MNTFNVVGEEEQVESTDEEGTIINIPYLNDDVVTQILIKVPSAESVYSFRCVCKLWYDFITDSLWFHQNLAVNSEPPGLLIQTEDNAYIPKAERLDSSLGPVTYTTRFFKLVKEGNKLVKQVDDLSKCFKYTQISDCFGGLLIATTSSWKNVDDVIYYIVNPVTKQRLKLPPRFEPEHYTKYIFVPSTGEYKALQLFCRQHYTGFYFRIVKLLSGTGDSAVDENLQWKLIKVPEHILIHDFEGRVLRFRDTNTHIVNGILYLTPKKSTLGRNRIDCFDACEEFFYEIAHPDFDPCFNNDLEERWYLQFGGSLGYMRFDTSLRPLQDRLDIYILIDEGPGHKGSEWRKQHSISLAPSIMRHMERDAFKCEVPFCTLREGEVIIFFSYGDKQDYRAYDIKLNRWWWLGINVGAGMASFQGVHVQRSLPVLASLF